jgi:hypothetical protein
VPDLTSDQQTIALAALAGVALISLLWVVVLSFRLRRLRKQYAMIRGDRGDRDIISTLGDWARTIDSLQSRIDGVVADHERLGAVSRLGLSKFHLVRYDAFEDMGGRLSFSAAWLDDHGDGLVLTSINGRTETRTYAKPIKALSSDHNLSDEESEAIAGAMAGQGRGQPRQTASR